MDASLVGVMPYTAIRLGSYDAMKAVWRRSTGGCHWQWQHVHRPYWRSTDGMGATAGTACGTGMACQGQVQLVAKAATTSRTLYSS